MQRPIRFAVSLFLAGSVAVASAQLSPEVLVKEYLLRAERRAAGRNPGAIDALDGLDALLREQGIALSDSSRLRYARVALQVGAARRVTDTLMPQLATADSAGTIFREATALLAQAENALPLEPEMVVIPAGRYRMGCVSGIDCEDSEKPVHPVTIRSFEMSKYEVTFEEYDRFAGATGRKLPNDVGWGRGRRPVNNVNWYEAVAYAR